MSTQQPDEIVRHEDGTIDISFYARRGLELRSSAKAEFMTRIVTTSGVFVTRWADRARLFGRGLRRSRLETQHKR